MKWKGEAPGMCCPPSPPAKPGIGACTKYTTQHLEHSRTNPKDYPGYPGTLANPLLLHIFSIDYDVQLPCLLGGWPLLTRLLLRTMGSDGSESDSLSEEVSDVVSDDISNSRFSLNQRRSCSSTLLFLLNTCVQLIGMDLPTVYTNRHPRVFPQDPTNSTNLPFLELDSMANCKTQSPS